MLVGAFVGAMALRRGGVRLALTVAVVSEAAALWLLAAGVERHHANP